MSTLQTCGMCGHTGPVRYDNRKNRRCENCWERVEGDTFDGVTPEEQATPAHAQAEEESAPTPTKTTKKGK